jgi:hypothetical protein
MEKDPKVGQAIAKLLQSNDKLEKQLASANAKIEAVKNALPDPRILGCWGAGPKAFVEKIRSIIDAP